MKPPPFTLCHRCGFNEATTTLDWAPAHTGPPYCQRCVTEEQLDHALERSAEIQRLTQRLEELGGRAERVICGYVNGKQEDDPIEIGWLCIGDKHHDGFHTPALA